MQKYYCYIISNKNRIVLYIGYTEDIKKRLKEHLNGRGAKFIKRYNVHELAHLEEFETKKLAKGREKQLKNWHKEWKWNLIKESNPNLETLEIN
ncbi:GIY-YIG nuclease family protein [Winogradskyella litoriviva]|uniref:GIY-YIG nuclease family protein n=1 Tax=Winogradskyella litoriviva TaxID=1220182 RepID=A0ABX2E5M0_9FLAO|nr:GIY-YIG nuclease family protein [Winogradskyella litoriviva]NRD23560.1 GIY-YIG nuclease family protein [Winogradskyella litoriviva]